MRPTMIKSSGDRFGATRGPSCVADIPNHSSVGAISEAQKAKLNSGEGSMFRQPNLLSSGSEIKYTPGKATRSSPNLKKIF